MRTLEGGSNVAKAYFEAYGWGRLRTQKNNAVCSWTFGRGSGAVLHSEVSHVQKSSSCRCAPLPIVPIGTPNTDFYGGDRKGSNPYGSTLVALDAATGKLKWYFQTTHHDNWDYDLASAPILITARQNGKNLQP